MQPVQTANTKHKITYHKFVELCLYGSPVAADVTAGGHLVYGGAEPLGGVHVGVAVLLVVLEVLLTVAL